MKKLFCFLTVMACAIVFVGMAYADHSAVWGPLGVQRYDPAKALDGYTCLHAGRAVWFINNEGNVVHKFVLKGELPSVMTDSRAFFTTQGWFMSKSGSESWDAYDMNGNLVQRFFGPEGWEMHHSPGQMPNGNIMGIARTPYTREEAIAAGRRPDLIDPDEVFKPDGVIIWDPDGTIVWTIDMMRDGLLSTVKSYDKIYINVLSNRASDFQHMNGVGYDEQRNWVVTSNRDQDEILAFDYATKELVWRWGNPANWDPEALYPYSEVEQIEGNSGLDMNDIDMGDQQLAEQHCAKFNPFTHNVTIFNNGYFPTGVGSLLQEINPDTDEVVFQWPSSPNYQVWASRVGSHQTLANGNHFGNFRERGLIEVTPEGEVVWEYLFPLASDGPRCFIDVGATGGNPRMGDGWKFPVDYAGFQGVTFNVDPPQPFIAECEAAIATVPVWQQEEPVIAVPTVSVTGGSFSPGNIVDVTATVSGPGGPYDVVVGFAIGDDKFHAYATNMCLTTPAEYRNEALRSDFAFIETDITPGAGMVIQMFDFTLPVTWGDDLEVEVFAEVYNFGFLAPIAEASDMVGLYQY